MSKELSQAALDVLAERLRQMDVEGWTPAHDCGHGGGEIATAAACYALCAGLCDGVESEDVKTPVLWPWDDKSWKPTNKRRDLVKAAALLLAEIERIDHATAVSN